MTGPRCKAAGLCFLPPCARIGCARPCRLQGSWAMTIRIRPAEAGDVAGILHVRISVSENALSMAELAGMGITP